MNLRSVAFEKENSKVVHPMTAFFGKIYWFVPFFWLFIGWSMPLVAMRFDNLTVDDGLSQNAVTCIIQDSRGYMWIGTHDGLNRFDGYEFLIYKNDPENPISLSDNAIRGICEDEAGFLWVATMGGGLNRLDPLKQTFTRFQHGSNQPEGIRHNEIFDLFQDRHGRIWLSHPLGVDWFHPGDERFNRADAPRGKFFEDLEGNVLLIALDHKLYAYQEAQNDFVPYRHNSIVEQATQIGVESESGELFLFNGTEVTLFNPLTGQTNSVIDIGVRIPAHVPVHIHRDRSGNILIGTLSLGLIIIDTQKNTSQRYLHNPLNPNSISDNIVYDICEDHSGVIWIATQGGGISTLKPEKWKFPHVRHVPGEENGLKGNNISCLLQNKDGDLWVGTAMNGLFHRKINGDSQLSRSNSFASMESVIDCQHITSLTFSLDQTLLWIGTMCGLYKIHLESGVSEQFLPNPQDPHSLSEAGIRNVFIDSREDMWLIANETVERRPKGDTTFKHYNHDPNDSLSISSGPGYPILESDDGTVWIGSWGGGLNKYLPEKDGFKHYVYDSKDPGSISHNRVWAITEAKDGTMWVGTYGGGLNRFDRKTDRFTRYTEKQGLANNVIYAILEDEQERLWMSTNRGLSCFTPANQSFRNYGVSDGVQSREFNTGAFFKAPDGTFYFGGVNGFNLFKPEDIRDNPFRPPVHINRITLRNRNVMLDHGNELQLTYSDNHISFEFSALDFNDPQRNRYAVRLTPLEKDWRHTHSNLRFAEYHNLTPGRYHFQVRGSNQDGVWNEGGVSVAFVIPTPFWMSWWFRGLLFLVFGFVFYGAIELLKSVMRLYTFWNKSNKIGPYQIIQKLGNGGMGTVYKCRSPKGKPGTLAIKVLNEELSRDDPYRKRFLNEADLINQVHHPHIVKMFDRGVHDGTLFFAMEYIDGRTLRTMLSQQRFSQDEFLRFFNQSVSALAALHSHRIVHRDLKPENIMIKGSNDQNMTIKLLDFGLAKMQHATRITKTGMFMGTLGYTPPEQVSGGSYGYPGDIYALGVVLYELLTGECPFFGDSSLEIMKQILHEDPIPPEDLEPECPKRWSDRIVSMMRKDPAQRPSIEDLLTWCEN